MEKLLSITCGIILFSIALQSNAFAWNPWTGKREVSEIETSIHKHIAEGDFEVALETLVSLEYENSSDPNVIRASLPVLRGIHPEKAYEQFQSLVKTDASNDDDLRALANLSFDLEKNQEAEKHLETLLEKDPKHPGNLLLKTRAFLSEGAGDQAIELINEAQKRDFTNPYIELYKAVLLSYTPDIVYKTQAKVALKKLSKRYDTPGLDALLILLSDNRLPLYPDEIEGFLTRLKSHPFYRHSYKIKRPDVAQLLAFRFAQYDVKEAQMHLELAMQQGLTNLANRVLFVSLLHSSGKPLEATQELSSMLTEFPEKPEVQSLNAENTFLQGNEDKALELYRELSESQPNNPTLPLEFLRILSSKTPQPGTTLSNGLVSLTLEHAQSSTDQKVSALEIQFGKLIQEKEYEQSLEVIKKLAALLPDDAGVINNYAYMNILYGKELNQSIARMKQLVNQYPQNTNFIGTLALALMKAQRHEDALELMKKDNIDWSKEAMSSLVVYIAALDANGRERLAKILLEKLEVQQLLEPEKELVAHLMR